MTDLHTAAREADDDLDAAVVEILRYFVACAAGENQGHLYEGDCPDQSQPDSRDPACPACKAMEKARAAAAAVELRRLSTVEAELDRVRELTDAEIMRHWPTPNGLGFAITFARAVIAKFCRVNGITIGAQP